MSTATATDQTTESDETSDDCGTPSANANLPLSMAGNGNPWLLTGVVSIATFMEVLDTSIANVALLHIAGEMGADVDQSTWILTSYLVSNAIILPLSGWLSTVIGRKPFYMSCVALFTFSSLACGLAPSLAWLIGFRVLQGMGGGGLAPSEQAILHDSFPQAKWGKVFAIYGIAVVVAPAVGPALGGWITDNFSWRWIFFINVPVGLISLTLSHLVLHEPAAECKRRTKLWKQGFRVDYLGFGLTALGLGCLQVVLDKGQRDDWFGSNFIVGFSLVAGFAMVALVIRELLAREPVINLRLLKKPSFAASNAMMFAMGFILFGSTQLLPQFVQEVYGYTATDAGLIISPGGVAVIVLMPVVGFLLGHVQPKYLVAVGMGIEALALWHMAHLNGQASFETLAWSRVFQASGLAFLFTPITTVAYVGLPEGTANDASALVNLSRNVGGSFGISAAQTFVARRNQFHQSRLVEHLTPYDAPYRQTLDALVAPLVDGGTAPAQAQRQALGEIVARLYRQANTLAFLDVFFIMACVAALLIPLAFMLQNMKPGEEAHVE